MIVQFTNRDMEEICLKAYIKESNGETRYKDLHSKFKRELKFNLPGHLSINEDEWMLLGELMFNLTDQ